MAKGSDPLRTSFVGKREPGFLAGKRNRKECLKKRMMTRKGGVLTERGLNNRKKDPITSRGRNASKDEEGGKRKKFNYLHNI